MKGRTLKVAFTPKPLMYRLCTVQNDLSTTLSRFLTIFHFFWFFLGDFGEIRRSRANSNFPARAWVVLILTASSDEACSNSLLHWLLYADNAFS
ncbi:MAG: hypothetical protein Ct9H90mP27_6170 [Gammaproteobacteria bacterium]|nr:MAG: hypothetical protein Ct9H90mP27_6170 [Gammaproteobacteria bacterium]